MRILHVRFKIHKVPGVVQFSLLNGSIHDSWLQQGHEGVRMDEDIRAQCEVLVCRRPPPPAEGARKKAPKSTEVSWGPYHLHGK